MRSDFVYRRIDVTAIQETVAAGAYAQPEAYPTAVSLSKKYKTIPGIRIEGVYLDVRYIRSDLRKSTGRERREDDRSR